MLDARATTTPLPSEIKFDNSTSALLYSPDRYPRLVGNLLYLDFLQSDISFVVQQLSFFTILGVSWGAIMYHYLKGSPGLGLFFLATPPSNYVLTLIQTGHLASTQAALSLATMSSWVVLLFHGKTKKQTVVTSSAEANRNMVSTVCELLWIHYLLQEFQVSPMLPIPFWCDNKVVIHIAENPNFHEWTKISKLIAIWSVSSLSKDLLLCNTSSTEINS
ncbi:UNVERIFIED_CONTAM: hypothetical protein Sradi_0730300 [Sesamum radiatum]|uniref:Uncharacterized protein n=1 Tax=Sesamum radiatum TaxID=300843 RepID=A0AAW2VP75_SESRA